MAEREHRLPVGEDAERFGQWIRTLRKTAGLTQKQLGDRIGVDRIRVNRWENGENVPNGDHLVAVIHACGFRLEEDAPPLPPGHLPPALLAQVEVLAEAVDRLRSEIASLTQEDPPVDRPRASDELSRS